MNSKSIKINDYEYSYYDVGDSSDVLIFLHGAFHSMEFGARFFPSFKMYRCISLDLPGHNGLSKQGLTSLDQIVDYLDGLVSHLEYRTVSLVGFSFGAIIAALYVDKYRAKRNIKKVVLWSGPFNGIPLTTIMGLKFMYLFRGLGDHWRYSLIQKILAVFNLRLSAKEVQSILSGDVKYICNLLGQIKNIRVNKKSNVMIIMGDHEKVFDVKNTEEIGGSDMIRVVKGGGHFGTKEGWKASTKLVKDFLRNE
ncbi:MAG: Hydrolase [candidate division WS6 bacterium GW2011_GWF2_39_15]|uniref:Hydrolase n=1 Tax=candidate division WS6 bacterium GW2011_GWF2_39_15 TaxID=1619100 RepID=A0A0G0N038_9BACT|nr:MAG: Hydrolase [candidate division WS6 bacterium GW2011_GWF2_39_15]